MAVNPLLEKAEMRAVRFNVGAGILELAAPKVVVVESLLPSCTVQLLPPNCAHISIHYYRLNIST